MKKKKGFTLVELLAVIVILAVILIIAVPQIMSVIESARKGSIESTAKLIAEGAEREYTNRKILGKDTNIKCGDVSSMNSNDYGSCVISFDSTGKATVTITGKGKFEGYTCKGNSTNMECFKGEIPAPTPTDASYFSYSEVEGGIAITGYLVGDLDDVVVKDKDKCVNYYVTTLNTSEEEANTLCAGEEYNNNSLNGDVTGGYISSSDYALAGLEVTYKNGGGTDVVIPSEIDGKKVVAIGNHAFTTWGTTPTNIKNTKKASISYLCIDKNKYVAIPLTTAPTGLGITSVVIPDTIKSIGEGAFWGNKLAEVTIPNGVVDIDNYAFIENQLTEVTIPSSVTSIGNDAFAENYDITIINNSSLENSHDVWNNIVGSCSINGNVIKYATPIK